MNDIDVERDFAHCNAGARVDREVSPCLASRSTAPGPNLAYVFQRESAEETRMKTMAQRMSEMAARRGRARRRAKLASLGAIAQARCVRGRGVDFRAVSFHTQPVYHQGRRYMRLEAVAVIQETR